MNQFIDLLRSKANGWRPSDQLEASRRFPDVVATSPFHLWRPGDPIFTEGNRLLLGVATWSGYDMRLLDVIQQTLADRQVTGLRVDVFNVEACQSPESFEHFIPGVGVVYQTPVAGLWEDGVLRQHASGYAARQLAARACDLDFPSVQQQVLVPLNQQ
jgi:hypothetical protein